jgi:hypothetical protein
MAPVPVGATAGPGAAATGSGTPAPSDFNGDGFSDLAIGVRGEDVGPVLHTGAINVLYATVAGLTATGNQFWDQASTGSASNGFDDGFGFASTSGDFDGDGWDDAAVSAPGKEVGGAELAGAVSVLYGSASGLAAAGSQQWTQNSADVEDDAETEDFFGWSLVAGDFNGDGFDDLAIGVPGETVAGRDDAGAVSVLLGTPSGLTATGDQRWHQDSTDINNKAETDDNFGLGVGSGDFDGNGYDDLAVGVPLENLEKGDNGGGVNVIYGSATGLTSVADNFWHQDVADINNEVESDDWFGYRVAGGDFNGDGFDDLLTGVPDEDLSGGADAGGISVIYGSASGLSAAGDDFWHQDSTGITNEAETGDEFGISVAAGDFDGDGFDDAAAGVTGEDVSGASESGGVAVIYGTAGGLDDPNNDFWHQDITGIMDSAEFVDLFGFAVMAANFGNGPEDDLAVGVVLEVVTGENSAGAVNVIYGSPSDLISTGNQFWHQDRGGILDTAEADDWFGFGLAQPGAGAGPSGSVRGVVTPADLPKRRATITPSRMGRIVER